MKKRHIAGIWTSIALLVGVGVASRSDCVREYMEKRELVQELKKLKYDGGRIVFYRNTAEEYADAGHGLEEVTELLDFRHNGEPFFHNGNCIPEYIEFGGTLEYAQDVLKLAEKKGAKEPNCMDVKYAYRDDLSLDDLSSVWDMRDERGRLLIPKLFDVREYVKDGGALQYDDVKAHVEAEREAERRRSRIDYRDCIITRGGGYICPP